MEIINIHWTGPYKLKEAQDITNAGYVLYQIYGTHPVFGPKIPLYVGKTECQNTGIRLAQHDYWMEDEYDEVTIHLGSIGFFDNWNDWYDDEGESYEKPPKALAKFIADIEKLLIVANQPLYNTQNRGAESFDHDFIIYNTGKMGRILPESSSEYYSWTRRAD